MSDTGEAKSSGGGGSGVLCTECGQDVGQTTSTRLMWTHPLRLIPLVVFIGAIVGAIALSTPLVSFLGYSGGVAHSWSTKGFHSVSGLLEPIKSTADLRAAGAHDPETSDQLLRAINSKLGELEGYLWEGKIRFVTLGTSGVVQHVAEYGIGSTVFEHYESSTFTDVRDPSSFAPIDIYPLSSDSVSYGPIEYSSVVSAHNGTHMISVEVSYIALLVQLAACWLVAWIIRKMFVRFGVQFFASKAGRVVVLTFVLAGSGVVSILFPRSTDYVIAGSSPIRTTAWKPFDDIKDAVESAIENPSESDVFLALLDGLLVGEDEQESLIGIEIDALHDTHQSYWRMGFEWDVEIASGGSVSYSRLDEDGIEVPVIPGPQVQVEHAALDHSWRNMKFVKRTNAGMRYLSFSPVSVLGFIAMAIWFWKFERWISLGILRRIHRRRVKRVQCIFCAYPLSDPALQARFGDKSPQNLVP